MQTKLALGSLESMGDANLGFSSGSDGGPVEDDPLFYERLQGFMTKKWITKIVLGYRVFSEFVCKLLGDTKCISYPSPTEEVVYKEMFKAGFHLSLYLFFKHLLASYGLVLAQLHSNAWRGIINSIVKCEEMGLKPKMRTLKLA